MATTTNYGWTTPDDTALVKDGAAAIRTLGSSIDTSLNTALGTKKAGLVLLNTTSFSGVASISLPADTFTTTYDHYEVLLSVSNATSNETNLLMRLRAAGSDNTTANYGNFIDRYGLNAVSYPQSAATTTTFAVVGTISNLNRSGFTFKIMSPKLAQATSIHSQGISPTSGSYSGAFSHNGNAIFATTTSFDSATFYTSENITGTYSVYGYNK
jgi:hypothetical protein